ncbi:MAG: TetR/AcrR family transcriptional regulator [Chitinophagaceae bacterium]|nr:TetR/AcrR family transcriptional regulator [Chitinophagaceae bacterium]
MVEIDTNERIKRKAHELFMRYGLRSVSMDDIAQSLGISKKTIYQFFKDKDELIVDIVDQEIKCRETCCENDRIGSDNAIHEIFLAMDMAMEIFRNMNPSVVYDMQKYHPKAFRIFSNHKHQYLYNMIHENIERGIREELYRSDLNVDILTHYRIENMMLPFNPEFHTKVKSNLAKIEEEFIIHYLFGLASIKGHKLILKYQKERIKKLNTDGKK